MKKFILGISLLIVSIGNAQTLLQGFESAGSLGATFGGLPTPLIETGTGSNNSQVLKIVTNPTQQVWQGVNLNLSPSVNLTVNKTLTIDVLAFESMTFLVKVTTGGATAAAPVTHNGNGTWQTLSFTFNTSLDGQTANPSGTYSGFVIHPYWGVGQTAFGTLKPPRTFYVDNISDPTVLLTGNIYINDGTFAAGDFCTAAGQDIAANDGTPEKPFATLAYALTRSAQAPGTIFYIDAGTYSWPATHTFTASGTVGNPITIQGKGSETNVTSTTATNSGLYFTTGSNWVVKDLNWTATNARSVWVESATGISLENSTFHFTSASTALQSIIINNAAGKLTIKNCTLSRSNTSFHMIQIVAGTSLTLQDNTIRFPAVAAVGTASSVHVESNAASVLIMERNKLYGGGYGVGFTVGSITTANANTIIKNNFFSTNWGIVNTLITGLKVYNNSFYTANNCIYGITPAFMNNWDIQNNILYTYGAAVCVFVNATTAATMNYNHYYYPNGTGAVNLSGTIFSLAAWKASANPVAIRETNGQGGNATADNPLYVNIASLATNDLHLSLGSPTIGAGVDVGVTDDIDGDARPLSGTFDIGADEFDASTFVVAPTITNFSVPAQLTGAVFELTAPTSNSSGAFSYTSSNNAVATVSGSTVTVTGTGSTVITATQAAVPGEFSEGSITATLNVTLGAAPTQPARLASDVISLFAVAYTNVAGTNFNPNWGQTGFGSFTQPSYGGDQVLQYANLNYQGTETAANVNATDINTLHINLYSTTLTSIRLSVISFGPTVERPIVLTLVPNQWNTFNIDLTSSTFNGLNRAQIRQFKYDEPRINGVVTNGQTLIVDNIYFWREAGASPSPTITGFSVPAQVLGAEPFELTPPTSNSNGAFTYTSSNAAVATVSSAIATRTWEVGNNGASDYTFSGDSSGSDINITATAGSILIFNVNASGHPFWIKTSQVTGAGSGVTTGTITGNGSQNGTISWNTSGVSPGTYYYICEFHGSMAGTITITSSVSTINVLGVGTSIITATQEAVPGEYLAGTTTANFVVTPPAAPTPPNRNAANVISFYSDSYGLSSTPTWAGSTNSQISISGDPTRLFSEFTNGQIAFAPTNVSQMTHVHVDVFSVNLSPMWFFMGSEGATKRLTLDTPANGWTSLDIPLSDFTSSPTGVAIDLNAINLFRFENPVGATAPPRTVYIANIYFYRNDTWTGATDTNWSTTTNWLSGSVPTESADVIIPATSNQPIIAGNVTVSSLTINNGATLLVVSGNNLTVSTIVTNSGTLTLQNNANLIQSSSAISNHNSGNIVVKRNSSLLLRLDHTLWSSPVAGQNLFSFSPQTLTNRFYTYNTSSNGYVSTGLDANTIFTPGNGYAIRAPNNHPATVPTLWEGSYVGVPNNGTIPHTVSNAGSGFNLIGNPYPSPIDALQFITENSSSIGGTLYFYAHSLTMNADGSFPDGTNYSTWNSAASTVATTAAAGDPHPIPVVPNGIIQVGQGFIVKATNSGVINFKNTMRIGNNADQFLRSFETEKSRVWLNLSTESGTDINQIAVAYLEGATDGVDNDYDGLALGNSGSYLSSKIDNDHYVIQSRGLPFDANDQVALGFRATFAGNYKIILSDKDGLFSGDQDIFIRDNLLGIEHNIKISPYLFSSQIGTFHERFQLVFSQVLDAQEVSFNPSKVIVFKVPEGLKVVTNNVVIKDIYVFDISGRLILKQENVNESSSVIAGLPLAHNVFLLKIISQEDNIVTTKVIN